MNEQPLASSRLLCACAFALSVAACSDSIHPVTSGAGGNGTSTAGTSGSASAAGSTGSGGAAPGSALSWDADGFVAAEGNPFSIRGPFYAYSDCEPPSGLPCTAWDASLTGADGKPGWSVERDKVCLKGTAVKVDNAMFSAQWGAGLALDLNSEGGEPGAPAPKQPFDLSAAGIRGFSIDLTGTAPARIRINLTMPGLADSSFVDAQLPGTTSFELSDIEQGSWVKERTPFDSTRAEALQLQVFTNAAAPTPFDFCVTAIRTF